MLGLVVVSLLISSGRLPIPIDQKQCRLVLYHLGDSLILRFLLQVQNRTHLHRYIHIHQIDTLCCHVNRLDNHGIEYWSY